MAITDGTQVSMSGGKPITPQTPNTQPEIKINLNFDEQKKEVPEEKPRLEIAQNSEMKPEEIILTGIKTNETLPVSEPPAFLKIDPIQETAKETAKETKVIETQQEIKEETQVQQTNDRLVQEDALVQKTEKTAGIEIVPQETQKISNPETNTIPETGKISDQIEIKKQDPLPEDMPNITQNMPNMNLQADMKIIQNLTTESKKTVEDTAPVTQKTENQTEQQTNTLNLDTLLQSMPQQGGEQQAVVQQAVVQQTPIEVVQQQVPPNPIPFLTEEKKTKGTKILLFVLLFVSLGAVGFFVLKTMYPVEMAGFISFPTETVQTPIIEEPLIASGNIEEQNMSGDVLSGEILSGSILNTTQEQEEGTGQHGSADDTMFNDLEDLSTEVNNAPDSLINKLHLFMEQGSAIFEKAKTENDKIGMKFGGYIRNKATSLANSLESGEQLDTQMVQNYLAQFSGYLSQLQPQANETDTQGSAEVSPSLSGDTPADILSGQGSDFGNTTGIFQTQ